MINKPLPDEIEDPDQYLRENPELKEELKRFFREVREVSDPDGEPRILGDFRIIRELGSGGMATVFEAEQISMRRRVALKILPSHMNFSTKAVKKFQREAEAGGRQNHPGIVAIHAMGKHGDVHYIAEELVEGAYTLEEWLKEQKKKKVVTRETVRSVTGLFAEIADALHHAHTTGVIHRDVKPSNILLTKAFKPKVTDFGLARVEGALALSTSGDFMGTVFYMSPEQAVGSRSSIDHRTDIFSLGVTLYECLTLQRPFDRENPHLTLQQIAFSESRDPRRLNRRIPRDLATICLKAMEKDPPQRYGTMADFSDDLRRFLNHEEIIARPRGAASRFWKLVKRNPAVSTLTSVVLLGLVTFLLYLLWSYPTVLNERRNALQAKQTAEQEATKSETVSRLLEEIFSSPDPGKEGRNVTVAEMLDKAVEKIGSTLSGQPEIEARLRGMVGGTYSSLGLYHKAEQQYSLMGEILSATLGKDHPQTLSAINNLAAALCKRGRLLEAHALHQKVLVTQRKVLGEEHPDTLQTKHDLAMVLDELGRYKEAETIHRAVLEVQRRTLGEEDKETLDTMNNLANILGALGAPNESEKLFHQIIETQTRLLGKAHPDTLNTRVNLMDVIKDDFLRIPRASQMSYELLEECRRVLGEDHPITLSAKHAIAGYHLNVGTYSAAESLYREIIETQRRLFGNNYPRAFVSVANLLLTLTVQENYSEAEALFKEEIARAEHCLPEEHPSHASLHVFYGQVLQKNKRFEEAEFHLLKGYKGLKTSLGIREVRTRYAIRYLVDLYDALGKPDRFAEFHALLLPDRENKKEDPIR